MAVTLTGAGGLFTILGQIFGLQDDVVTKQAAISSNAQDVVDAVEELPDTLDYANLLNNFASSIQSWQEDSTALDACQRQAGDLIIEMVHADNPLPSKSLGNAIGELINQLEGSGGETSPDDSVDRSTATATATADSGNTGDGVLRCSVTQGNARHTEIAYAEDIEVTVANSKGNQLRLQGEQAAGTLSQLWPDGSGSKTTLGVTSGGGLLSNGGMDDEDDRANTPDDWVIETGTIGTTILMSDYEVQTVTISGTPTEGTYVLKYTSVDSDEQLTAPIDYDAGQAAVQTALRRLVGLENVTVSTSGTSPNYTHTITFEGLDPPGNIGLLTSTNTFDTGSIAHAQTTAGTSHVYRDKAVIFDSNGSELTAIRQRVELDPRTAYCFNAFMKVDSYPAAGQLEINLVDGAGTIIDNVQGVDNSILIDPTSGGDLSTSEFTAVGGWFQTPNVLPTIVYLQIKIKTAVSNTASVYIDDCSLVQGVQLYTGGPLVAAFAGQTDFAPQDKWTIVVTNDRAGGFQEWFYRNGFVNGNTLLPSDSSGSETINDSLIT